MKLRPKDNLPDDIGALKQLVLAQQRALDERQSTLVAKQDRIQFLEALVILFGYVIVNCWSIFRVEQSIR